MDLKSNFARSTGLKNYNKYIFNTFFSCRIIWEILIPGLFWSQLQDWTYLKKYLFSYKSKRSKFKFWQFYEYYQIGYEKVRVLSIRIQEETPGRVAPFLTSFCFEIAIFFVNQCEKRKLFWNQREKLNILDILHVQKVQI